MVMLRRSKRIRAGGPASVEEPTVLETEDNDQIEPSPPRISTQPSTIDRDGDWQPNETIQPILEVPGDPKPQQKSGQSSDAYQTSDDAQEGLDSSTIRSRRGRKNARPTRKADRSYQSGAVAPEQIAMEPYPDYRNTRMYHGPLPRYCRGFPSAKYLYGPHPSDLKTFQHLLDCFSKLEVLPARQKDSCAMHSVWVPSRFAVEQQERLALWLDRWQADIIVENEELSIPMTLSEAISFLPQTTGKIRVLLGPQDQQRDISLGSGDSLAIDSSGLPLGDICAADEDKTCHQTTERKARSSGWLLDVGGIVLSMEWAPLASDGPQVLTLTTVPHKDQRLDHKSTESFTDSEQCCGRTGCVQIWAVTAFESAGSAPATPSTLPATRVATLYFKWGRVTRVAWCPVAVIQPSLHIGILAVLCEDGAVRVIRVKSISDGYPAHEQILRPMVTLSLEGENAVHATSFAWAGINKLVVGYRDGSIALWSIHPRQLLSRHPVLNTYVLEIATGYPSNPYLIAACPVSGFWTQLDLTNPSRETTAYPARSVYIHPHQLRWSEFLQSFMGPSPNSSAFSPGLCMSHARHFPTPRRFMRSNSVPSCTAIGQTHPFALVGCFDGALWATNPVHTLFGPRLLTAGRRMKLLHHEFRPTARWQRPALETPDVRGAARILHGWIPENLLKPQRDTERSKSAKTSGSKAADDTELGVHETKLDDDDLAVRQGADKDDEIDVPKDPVQAVTFEPLSRISIVAWNPNIKYGCWAAAAMASGLVRILDLGVDV